MADSKSKTISVIISAEMVAALEEKMKKEERNMSWIVRKAIQEYLENHKGE
jgi:metal-responsive CopG/Arc/MetJ family transcriptional regulator